MIKLFKSLIKGKEDSSNNKEQKNFEILKYDGMRAQRMGRIDYAIKCFTGALDIQEDFETLHFLSQIYTQTGELDKARKLLERMAELEPELTATHLTLANVYYMLEEYSLMAEAAQHAIQLENENSLAYYLLAKATYRQKDLIHTIAHLTKAIALKEDFLEALLMRAEVLTDMQQYEEALKDIETVLHHHAEEETALLLQGKIKEATGLAEEAEQLYRQVTELNPFNEHAYINLGQLFIAQKKLGEAITLLDEAVELNPNSAQAFHERGRAKLLNGDKEGSAEDMKTALQLKPENIEKLSGQFNNQQPKSSDILGL